MLSSDPEGTSVSINERSSSENKENNMSNLQNNRDVHSTPSKREVKSFSSKSCSFKSSENYPGETTPGKNIVRRSSRTITPNKKYDSTPGKTERRSSSRKKTSIIDLVSDESSDSEDLPLKIKSTQLFEDRIDVDGKQMFCFSTPKKRDAMALVAMNTPKSQKGNASNRNYSKTPDSKRKKSAESEPKTPYHIRKRVKEELTKLVQDSSNSDFSGDESEFFPDTSDEKESSSEVESEEEQQVTSRKSISIPILRRMSARSSYSKKAEEYIPESDGYFTSYASSKIITSDHTLDRLKNPRLPADQIFSLLTSMKLSEEHESAISSNLKEYEKFFSKWMFIMNEGYNILLYGLGSKRSLLQKFHREVLADQTVLVINGFFPSLTIKEILDSITNDILDLSTVPANPHEAVDLIEEEFTSIPETHLFLIVHNIDGAMLRNSKAQEILSRLSKISNVHLLASIDHINTPLLWDHKKLSNYNFSWWDVTTMLPYSEETGYENSLLVQNSGGLALSSMRNVFQSLTTNARGIYMIIVTYQLKFKGDHNYQGIPFKDLYSACREAFLVSSDLALRAQLTEFLDHKLVKSKRNIDGTEHLYIPIESSLLQQFVEQQR